MINMTLQDTLVKLQIRKDDPIGAESKLKQPFVDIKQLCSLIQRINKNPDKKKYIKLNAKLDKHITRWHLQEMREERISNLKTIIKTSIQNRENVDRYYDILTDYGCLNRIKGISGSIGLTLITPKEISKVTNKTISEVMSMFSKYDQKNKIIIKEEK